MVDILIQLQIRTKMRTVEFKLIYYIITQITLYDIEVYFIGQLLNNCIYKIKFTRLILQ